MEYNNAQKHVQADETIRLPIFDIQVIIIFCYVFRLNNDKY